MLSLLEKAKQVKIIQWYRYTYTDEDIDLVLAWLNGDIRTAQLIQAKWGDQKAASFGGKALYYVASILKYAVNRGIVEIKKK